MSVDFGTLYEEETAFLVRGELVSIVSGATRLCGILSVPEGSQGIVVLTSAGDGQRYDQGLALLADALQEIGLATLLVDLLPEDEVGGVTPAPSDPVLLAARLLDVSRALSTFGVTAGLRIGYFGAGLAGAASLQAAAQGAPVVKAIFSLNGWLDRVTPSLKLVQAPTMLAAGEADREAVQHAHQARLHLRYERQLATLPGADPLAGQYGLRELTRLTRTWFSQHL